MRYVLAILALAISGVLLLLGIGQRTFLAAPTEIVYPLELEQDADYAIIDGEELSKVRGQANIVMRGSEAFVAVAKTRDVEGWLSPFDHVELAVDPSTRSISAEEIPGEPPSNDLLEVDDDGEPVPLDPRGSDLWLESESGSHRMPLGLAADQSLLISGDGETPIPAGASLVWVQDKATPWAGPLLAAGGLFALLGGVLYIIAIDRDRRALGPRRGRRGPLIGLRNVVGGKRRRAKGGEDSALLGDAPRQGSLTNAPALPPAAADADAENADAGSERDTQITDSRTVDNRSGEEIGGEEIGTGPENDEKRKGDDHAE